MCRQDGGDPGNHGVPTCAFITLGCKVNQYDTQAIREDLARRGYQEVPETDAADLYVVNTCCVTQESHRKSLQHVRHIARDHPNAMLIVTGCSVETDAEEIRAIPGVRAVVGNDAKRLLAAMVARGAVPSSGAVGSRQEAVGSEEEEANPPVLLPTASCRVPTASHVWPSISRFAGHTRAFVKIEDGCDSYCSYCVVPLVRGRVRSRPPDEVVDEVRRLVENGYREVVLTGIHLGAYGRDAGGTCGLVPLLERVAVSCPGLVRLRLSSLELQEVTDGLIDLVAASPVICPHFHIPLQSGDDAVLRAMNRRYTVGEFLARLDAIRQRIPEPAITTDVIVGFPGETDEQFGHTMDVARQAGFSRTHVFPYSDRKGTRASEMEGKLPRAAIDARRRAMLGVAQELGCAYHQRFVGREITVLVESQRDRRTGLLCGYSERYVRAFFEGSDDLRGRMVAVRVGQAMASGVGAEEAQGERHVP